MITTDTPDPSLPERLRQLADAVRRHPVPPHREVQIDLALERLEALVHADDGGPDQ